MRCFSSEPLNIADSELRDLEICSAIEKGNPWRSNQRERFIGGKLFHQLELGHKPVTSFLK